MKGIAVAGSILVDKIYTIDRYPKECHLTKIRKIQNAVGGLVPNVGMDIKAIAPTLPVYAYGRVGADSEGDFVLSQMEKGGVNVSKVVRDERERTSFTSVMSVIGGERTFFTYAGASSAFGVDDVPMDGLNAKTFHLGYFLLLDKMDGGEGLRLLQKLKERGITTSIDLVSEQSDRYKQVLPCLPFVDNLIVNEVEGAALAGVDGEDLYAVCKKLQELGVRERVIIHKSELAACLHGDRYTCVPSLCLPQGWIKGKTGAGDAFTAGCLVAIHDGETDEATLDFGNRCAAVSLRAENAVDGMMTKKEIYQITKGY